MEFNTNEILGSLQMNEYDETNGDIFDFKRRGHKVFAGASTISAKPVDPCPSPPPSPAHPSLYGLPPKRRAREPNLGLLHIQPSEEQGPVPLILSGHKVPRNITMLHIALCCTRKKNRACSCAFHSRAVVAPLSAAAYQKRKCLSHLSKSCHGNIISTSGDWVLQVTAQENQGLPIKMLLL